MPSTRRAFLAQASAAALLPRLAHAAQATPAPAPRDTVLKFNPDGTPHPFAGNTVICHLPAQCPMRDAMASFREALTGSSFLHKLGLTPVDSYHMTVFPGANDKDRAVTGWPSYVPLSATIQQCNQAVAERMAAAALHGHLPLRVTVDLPETLRYPRACTLRMKALTPADEQNLRSLRDQLSVLYGFRQPDHATYGFHITQSYQLAHFTPAEQAEYDALRDTHVHRIFAAQPVLELGNPEYCTFPDMFRFDPVHLLACC